MFKNKYNEKCDIWSCGIILYTMLCGHPPFRGVRETEVKNAIAKGIIEFQSKISFNLEKEWSKVTNEAKQFINLLLSHDPSKRPNAQEALCDKWFSLFTGKKDEFILDQMIIQNLTKFQARLTLQKATLSFIANQISQNDEIKKIKEEFDKIDHNRDGVLSKEELILCLSKIYTSEETNLRVENIFKEIDFNYDGTINFSEFLTVTMKRDRLLSEETLKNAFARFDLDGNGYLTIEELKETIPLDGNEEVSWEEVMKEVDKNGDGQVNLL